MISQYENVLPPPPVTTEQRIGATLRRLRKAAKVSQHQLAEVLEVHQSAISRIENGEQAILVSQLMVISKFFGVDATSMLDGRINYWQVANRFKVDLPLPDRYRLNMYSKLRELHPIIVFLNNTKGPAFTLNLFHTYNVESLLFASNDQVISTTIVLDLVRNLLQNKVLSEDTIHQLVDLTLDESYHEALFPIYQHQDNVPHLLHSYIGNMPYYGGEYSYDMESTGKNAFTITRRLKTQLYASADRDPVVSAFLCQYRQQLISAMPTIINAPALKIKKAICEEKGHHQCVYQVA